MRGVRLKMPFCDRELGVIVRRAAIERNRDRL